MSPKEQLLFQTLDQAGVMYQQRTDRRQIVEVICREAGKLEAEEIGPAIAEIDRYISETKDPSKLSFAVFALSRIPPYFRTEDILSTAERAPYRQWRTDSEVVALLEHEEFVWEDGGQRPFSDEEKAMVGKLFDLISPDRPKEKFYMDNVPNLFRAYIELMNETDSQLEEKYPGLGKKIRAEFADYLRRLFILQKELPFITNPRLEVGLLLAFQLSLLRDKDHLAIRGFNLAEAYRNDDFEMWKKGLMALAERKAGILRDVISTKGVNRSLARFALHSSVYNQYEVPGGGNDITRALLTEADFANQAMIDLGCGPWLLSTRRVWCGDILGIDRADFKEDFGKASWRIRVGPEHGDWEIMDTDHEVIHKTRELFEKGEVVFDGQKVRFSRLNYAKKALPGTDKSIGCIRASSSVWNTTKGEGRRQAILNILNCEQLAEGAIVELTGVYFEPVRTVHGIWLQKREGRWQMLGLLTYGREYLPGEVMRSSRYVFFQDRLTERQIGDLHKLNSQKVKLINSEALPSLFSII